LRLYLNPPWRRESGTAFSPEMREKETLYFLAGGIRRTAEASSKTHSLPPRCVTEENFHRFGVCVSRTGGSLEDAPLSFSLTCSPMRRSIYELWESRIDPIDVYEVRLVRFIEALLTWFATPESPF